MAALHSLTHEPLLIPPRRRHPFLSQLDGPDYQDAVDAADHAATQRDRMLYGDPDLDERIGWTKQP